MLMDLRLLFYDTAKSEVVLMSRRYLLCQNFVSFLTYMFLRAFYCATSSTTDEVTYGIHLG